MYHYCVGDLLRGLNPVNIYLSTANNSPVQIFMKAIKYECQQFLRIMLLKAIETWSILPNSPLHKDTNTDTKTDTQTHAQKPPVISEAQFSYRHVLLLVYQQSVSVLKTVTATRSKTGINTLLDSSSERQHHCVLHFTCRAELGVSRQKMDKQREMEMQIYPQFQWCNTPC